MYTIALRTFALFAIAASLLALTPQLAKAQAVTISDANLRAVIEDSLSKSSGATITRAEMATLTKLEAPNSNISDLTGLEYATGLTYLDLGQESVNNVNVNSNSISDLSALSSLTSLTWLELDSNNISNISVLSSLTSLRSLELSVNNISNISVLSSLTSLRSLDLGDNNISSISALSNLTSLTALYLSNNNISSISALSNLTSLTTLWLFGNNISNISALSSLTSLTWLWLSDNNISSISSLSNLTSLTALWLQGNDISDIQPLVANTGLGSGDEVDLSNNPLSAASISTHIPALEGRGVTVTANVTIPDANLRAVIEDSLSKSSGATISMAEMATLTKLVAPNSNISNLTGLEYATGLTHLDLGFEIVNSRWVNSNSISDLSPLADLTSLTLLELDDNNISSISSLSNLTSLTTLTLDDNNISSISSLSNLTSLTQLWLPGNDISDISSLSNLTSLTGLSLASNDISSISSLSNLTSLTSLQLQSNNISSISSLSNLTSLTELHLPGNNISSISALSNLTSLTYLTLQGNDISSISSLSNLTSLTTLDLRSNNISSISSLSNLTSLTWLGLDNNNILDIQPLVANTGLGTGDEVDLSNNPLSQTSISTHIPALEGRGVTVTVNVTIPDANLRAVIEDSLSKSSGATISLAEMATLTKLVAPNSNISNLTGLEYATGLTELDLGREVNVFVNSNSISDISPLAGLTSLTTLYLDDNNISDISSLSNLTSLTTLLLNNNLTSFSTLLLILSGDGNNISDISALSNLTSLTTLGLDDNNISSISALSNLTSLTSLYLDGNNISDISALSNLTSLTSLYLSDNNISSISALPNLTSLTTLRLDNNNNALRSLFPGGNSNNISSISALSNLTSLTSLYLSDNNISSISALSNLTSLTTLYLDGNNISDISALSNLTNLERLYLYRNSISNISSLSNLTSLLDLRLHYNNISDISPLVANTGLGSGDDVNVRHNPLSDAAISTHIPALQGRGVTVEFDIAVTAGETKTHTVNGQSVTVTGEAGISDKVEVKLPANLDRDVTITIAPPAPEVPLSGTRFGFGRQTDARTVVDIQVENVPSAGIEVCLPITPALRAEAEAGGAALILLRYDGNTWEKETGSQYLTDDQICATIMSFSPFAVGYNTGTEPEPEPEPEPDTPNSAPSFTDAVDFQRYQQGTPITPVIFPAVTDGDGKLTYSLPDLPPGLTYTAPGDEDKHSGILSGTPTEPQAKTRYNLTVTDEDQDEGSASFFIVIDRDLLPSFGDTTIAAQVYVQNREIEPLTLPRATSGDSALAYALTPDLPAGLTFDAETFGVSGTPIKAMGEMTYTLTATDKDGDAATFAFTVAVMADLMPTFGDTSIAAQSYLVNQEIDPLTLPQATGGDGPLAYAIRPLLPDALSFDPTTRTLSGMPLKAMAETEYIVTASDADGDFVSLTFVMEVRLPSPDFDGNGQVNFADFIGFVGKYGTRLGEDGYDARYDLNGDGVIGADDFWIFDASFGE